MQYAEIPGVKNETRLASWHGVCNLRSSPQRNIAMNILMISSECVPYAKTGGLADVVGALPKALKKLGHTPIVVMPLYSSIDRARHKLTPCLAPMGIWMGDTQEWCAVHKADMGGVTVYFIEHHGFFSRWGLYHDAGFQDYGDNPRRFAFLTRAALQLCIDLNFHPDVVHAHDWQAALAAAYLKVWHWNDPVLGRAASVLTIHNLAYQGVYHACHYNYVGLQWSNFTADKLESYGAINFLKGGLVYADAVNTVSPSYARETLEPISGCGLAPYLNNKGNHYSGILNGVDYEAWSPDCDKLLPARYSVEAMEGKARCKLELQARLGLEQDANIPIIGVVSRLVSQKGLDLLAACCENVLRDMRVQFAILGSGEKELEHYFSHLPPRFPGRIGGHIGYNEELSHLITAGSDFFVMPSRYEPCGLNQIYSLRYGTLPIVRATGGLDDTVSQYDEASGAGTGFKFWEPSPQALYYTLGWAVSTYYDRPDHVRSMIRTSMEQNFSWEKSAQAYIALYEQACCARGQ